MRIAHNILRSKHTSKKHRFIIRLVSPRSLIKMILRILIVDATSVFYGLFESWRYFDQGRRGSDSRYSKPSFLKHAKHLTMQKRVETSTLFFCIWSLSVSGRFPWVRNLINTISQSLNFENNVFLGKSKFASLRLRKPAGGSGGAAAPPGKVFPSFCLWDRTPN